MFGCLVEMGVPFHSLWPGGAYSQCMSETRGPVFQPSYKVAHAAEGPTTKAALRPELLWAQLATMVLAKLQGGVWPVQGWE